MPGFDVPAGRHRSELRVSNSRFITTVDRADTTAAAQTFLAEVRAEMPDATHHVHAFRIGHGASVTEGMSDDGEPSGTSGPPTLAVLRGSNLGNVVLVTTRYFGGTRLGTGGLVAAYSEAARRALAVVPVERMVQRVRLALTLPYAALEPLRRVLGELDGRIEAESFGADVALELALPAEHEAALAARVRDLTRGACRPQRL